MGCLKLKTDFFCGLEVIHSKKRGAHEKKRIDYYPFGLKHKNYNNNVTSSNPALDFKYNGVEQEKALGVNFYEMDLRQYDPAIARWTGIDPVTHHNYSPYSAFDNNPVAYADPSGADAVDGAAIGGNGGVSHSSVQGMLAADGGVDWGAYHGAYVTGSDPYRNTQAGAFGALDLYSHIANINDAQIQNAQRIRRQEQNSLYFKAYFELAASEFNFFVKSGGLSLTGQPPGSFGGNFKNTFVGTFTSIKSFFGDLLDNPLKTIDTAIKSSIKDGSIANAIPIVASFNALKSKGEALGNMGAALYVGDEATAGSYAGGLTAGLTIDATIFLTIKGGGYVFGVNKTFFKGLPFEEYKASRGGTQTLARIQTSTGVQRISTEYHHGIITQRTQRRYNLPNWLVNNRINVWKVNTVQHSLIDPHRFRFLRRGFKSDVGWFKRFNWFTKF